MFVPVDDPLPEGAQTSSAVSEISDESAFPFMVLVVGTLVRSHGTVGLSAVPHRSQASCIFPFINVVASGVITAISSTYFLVAA